MKTKLTMITVFITMFAFTNSYAQGRGNGKGHGNRGNSNFAKGNKNFKQSNKQNRDLIYRDAANDRNRRVIYDERKRRGTIYDRERSNDRRYRGNASNLPPGQAKKIYGHQSAKAFAPGQQKNNIIYNRYPERSIIFNRRYNDRDDRNNSGADLARRIGGLFGL